MNDIDDIKANSIKVNLSQTINFLEKYQKTQKGIIHSEIPTIDGIGIQFTKGQRCFNYVADPLANCEAPVRFQAIGYGFQKPFAIVSPENICLVKYGAGAIEFKLGTDISTEGELWQLESNLEGGNGFFRAVLPVDGFTQLPGKYIIGLPFLTETGLRYAGYIKIKCNEYGIGLYDYDIDKQRYIFIDCLNEIEYSKFEKIIESVIYSYGFISGCLVRNEIMILKHANIDFSQITGFQFRRVEDSIISSLELLNPREHKEWEKLKKMEFLSEDIFSNIVQHCFNDPRLIRSIRIITETRNLPTEIQAASIFVALETIKQIIIEDNIKKLSSFRNADLASDIINQFKKIIGSLPDDAFNNKKRVLNKLNELNDVGNNESFYLAFELMGIALNNDEKNCIKLRNRFLHGNIPFQNELEQTRKGELQKITLTAHLLTCSLILKYFNFSGSVKNFLKYWDLVNGDDKISSPLFKKI
jgi:hypothetical protein